MARDKFLNNQDRSRIVNIFFLNDIFSFIILTIS